MLAYARKIKELNIGQHQVSLSILDSVVFLCNMHNIKCPSMSRALACVQEGMSPDQVCQNFIYCFLPINLMIPKISGHVIMPKMQSINTVIQNITRKVWLISAPAY